MASTSHGIVLVIEDDPRTAELIATYLKQEGFQPLTAGNGKRGLDMIRAHGPVLVILDIMLPGMDGWDVCREMRRVSDAPVIMLTARGDEIDRISGLTLGADDYVVKPFSPRELMARVRAVLRRSQPAGGQAAAATLTCGDLLLDPVKKRVVRRGRTLNLTPHEYALLRRLMAAPGRVFSRDELISSLYPRGETHVVDRVVDVHIGKLRQKIEADPAHPYFIFTVRGMGYRFRDAEEAED
ncbi:MAG: response regulator transcription factor [Desulfosarcinaceae bacterium]|jgi:DNA-binding response OmpR family regulator